MVVALAESAGYLLKKLPISEQVAHDAQFLGHQSHGGRKGVSPKKRLCYHVAKALDLGTLMTVFNLKDDDTKTDNLADQFPEQFKIYQLLTLFPMRLQNQKGGFPSQSSNQISIETRLKKVLCRYLEQ